MLTLACAAVAPSAAVAQDARGAPPASAFRVGPAYLTPLFDIPVFGVDSNVFNETTDTDSDLTAHIQPQLQGELRMRRARIEFGQLFNFIYFQKYASERSFNSNSNARVDVTLSRLTLYGTAAYMKTNDRPGLEVDARVSQIRTPVGGGVLLDLTRKTSLDVGADFEQMRFEQGVVFGRANLRDELTRGSHAYHVGLRHALTPLTTAALTVRQQTSTFDFAVRRNNTALRVAPALVFRPNALISGTAEVGFMRFSTTDASIRDYRGSIARVDLAYVLRGVTRFSAQVGRDLLPSAVPSETFFLQTGMGANISHRASERWDVHTGVSRQRLTYGTSGSVDATTIRPSETFQSVTAGVGFRVSRGLRIGGRWEQLKRDSVGLSRAYDNTRVMTSFNFRFR